MDRGHDINIYFTPDKDAYIAEWFPNQNFGEVPYLYVSRYKQLGDIYRSLLYFDLCDLGQHIPKHCHIESAHLELPVYRNEIPYGSICVEAYRVLQPWSEMTVTWNNQPPFGPYPDGSAMVASGFFGTVSIELTQLVKGWYYEKTVNHGLILRGDEAENALVGFFSREYEDPEKWPLLKIRCHSKFHERCEEDDEEEEM